MQAAVVKPLGEDKQCGGALRHSRGRRRHGDALSAESHSIHTVTKVLLPNMLNLHTTLG